METKVLIKLLLMGFGIGVSSGLLGIGGGVLVVPALVLVLHFTQQKAVGTSLAMLLPPIGVFAVMRYWKAGQVNWPAAMTLAITFALGAIVGAWIVTHGWVSDRALRIVFVAFMLFVAGNMLFRHEQRVWAALATVAIACGYAAAYWGLRVLGKRWEKELCLPDVYRERLGAPVTPDYEI